MVSCCFLSHSFCLCCLLCLLHERLPHPPNSCLPVLYYLAKLKKKTWLWKISNNHKRRGKYTKNAYMQYSGFDTLVHLSPSFLSFAEVLKNKSKTPHSFTPTSTCSFKCVDIFIPNNKVIIKIDNNSLGLSNSLNIMKISKLLQKNLFIIRLFKSWSK